MILDPENGEIIGILQERPGMSSPEIHAALTVPISFSTFKRRLNAMIAGNWVSTEGNRKTTTYRISREYALIIPVDMEEYFTKEIDARVIQDRFNHELISETLPGSALFTQSELAGLDDLHVEYKKNISKLSKAEYKLALERLAIDLSWKSSQIEGNTYSLLETERLLIEQETASGKTVEEATMLLNHKAALDFIIANPDYISPLSISSIEDIHSLLIKGLGVSRNIRKRKVGISGTNYLPPDNEHHIREALEAMCNTVNSAQLVFEKALLLLVLISYIQPFADGNKRTARIISNAILMENGYCPLSFRTVDSLDYKKAMLIFYEQNNLSAMKKIFMEQFEFAVKTYF